MKTQKRYSPEIRDRAVRMVLEPIGDVPPAEFEKAYYAQLEGQAMAA